MSEVETPVVRETPKTLREYPYARARRWQNKRSKKYFKVIPWFQPIDNESRFDFRGMLLDIVPELENDVMAMKEIYSGMVVNCGWQLLNDAGCWFTFEHGIEDQFADLGPWKDEEGINEPTFPLTKKSAARAKRQAAKKKKAKKTRP